MLASIHMTWKTRLHNRGLVPYIQLKNTTAKCFEFIMRETQSFQNNMNRFNSLGGLRDRPKKITLARLKSLSGKLIYCSILSKPASAAVLLNLNQYSNVLYSIPKTNALEQLVLSTLGPRPNALGGVAHYCDCTHRSLSKGRWQFRC